MPMRPLGPSRCPLLQELVGLLFQLEAVHAQASFDMDWVLLMTEGHRQTGGAEGTRHGPTGLWLN